MFYNVLNSSYFALTKISIFGSIINQLEEQLSKDVKTFCRKNYENNYVYDIPLLTLPVKQIEIGEEHILILIIDGEVYGWGDSKNGACGTGAYEFVQQPKRIKFPQKNTEIIRVACGSRHSLAIDSNNCLYSWGQGKSGCLGHGNELDYNKPKLVEMLSNNKIEYISAGDNYSACVSYQMHLFTWGSGEFGRLGHSDNKDELYPKKVVEIKDGIMIVRCGYYCLLAFTVKKEIIAIGAKALFIKKQTEAIKTEIPYLKNQKEIRKIEIPLIGGKEIDIVDCVCGYQFINLIIEERTIRNREVGKKYNEMEQLVKDKNKIKGIKKTSLATVGEFYEKIERKNYLWGNINLSSVKFPQNFIVKDFLSYKDDEINAIQSQLLNYLSGGKSNQVNEENGVKKVLCSDNNTAVLTKEGELYIFGSYIYGVASKKLDQIYYPVPFRGKKVSKIALGGNHILALTSNYEVFGWGRNDCGQLGLGNAIKFYEAPIVLEKMKNKGIKTIKCSENYSACLSYNYELILFGDISFLENSQFINHQLSPKIMD